MTKGSRAQGRPNTAAAVALGAALLGFLGASGAAAQELAVTEAFRFFPGGRALAVEDEEDPVSRLGAAQTPTRDLGVTLLTGLAVGAGHTARVFDGPAALRADGETAALTPRFVTLHPLVYRGVPLAPGSDVLTIATSEGKVLSVRERNLPKGVDGIQPTVDAAAARLAALAAGRAHRMPADARAGEPTLEIFVDREARGRLAWRVRVESASLTAPWAREFWLAAIGKPAVLADREGIEHTHHGRATATAWTDTPLGPFPVQDLSAATVRRSAGASGTTTTGPDGRYAFLSGTASATVTVGVAGLHSTVNNVPGAELTASGTGSPAAAIDLFIAAATEAELAQTSAFLWTNRAHELTAGFRPAGSLARLRTNVNIGDTCNAFFSSGSASINFYRSGGGCVNTAYSDIVLHEYGHGADHAMGGKLDGGYSEGFGDALALLGTRQTACVGRDFFGAGTCLRDATRVLLWPPASGEGVHAIGHRYTGFVSALITELRRTYSPDDSFEIARQLIMGAAAANPSSVPDAVQLSFLVDDDDGMLANGTPHCAELAAAAESRRIPHPTCAAKHVRTMADLNNDGQADIVAFGDDGVWTALSAGDGTFAPERFVLANFGALQGWDPNQHVRIMADLNNDNRADIVAFGFHGVWTALSAGDGTFQPERFVLANFGFLQAWTTARDVRTVADLNNDGQADIVGFGTQGVVTALSAGDGTFAPERFVLANFGRNQGWDNTHVRTVADLNNDGQADIVAFGFHGVWTALSAGGGTFAPERFVLADFGGQQGWDPTVHVRTVADVSNDGRADIVAFGFHGVWTALATDGGLFAPQRFVLAEFGSNRGWVTARHVRRTADLSNDGRADIVAFGFHGTWTALSRGDGLFQPHGFVLAEFGENQAWDSTLHVRTMADLNADGRADIVAFGTHGVWTALSIGNGLFEPHRLVLGNFGTNQGWRGGQE
jgi:hypothetical protein